MKKIILSALVAASALAANAQVEAGSIQTSVDFKPFVSTGEMFSNTGINATYFITEQHAVRVGLDFANESVENASKKNGFGIALGYENHFKSYDKVDLYAGLEVSYRNNTTKSYTGEKFGFIKDSNVNALGVGVFTGINFYVYKGLFLGTEISFNYAKGSNGDTEYIDGDKVATAKGKGSISTLGFNVTPSLRLGWTF